MARHRHDQEPARDPRDQSELTPDATQLGLYEEYIPLTEAEKGGIAVGAAAARAALAGGEQAAEATPSPLSLHDAKVAALADLAMQIRPNFGETNPTTTSESDQETKKEKPVRHAFGWYMKPEQYNPFGDYDVTDVTDAERHFMTAERLEPLLFNPPHDAPNSAWQAPYNPRQRHPQIALNRVEFGMVTGSAEMLAKRVENKLLKTEDLTDERVAASARGGRHAVEAKQNAIAEHAQKLKDTRLDIIELQKYARKPGFTGSATHEEMKDMFSVAWNEFTSILEVLHVQRGWDAAKRQRAEVALVSNLTQGGQRDRVKNWQEMLDLSKRYLDARIGTFGNHGRHMQRLIVELEASEPKVAPETNPS